MELRVDGAVEGVSGFVRGTFSLVANEVRL
mgnify:CR=1 FL=1